MVGVVESSWLPWGTLGSSGKLPAPVGFTEPTCPIPLDFLSFQGSWMSQSPACARKMLWEATSESTLHIPKKWCTHPKMVHSPKK